MEVLVQEHCCHVFTRKKQSRLRVRSFFASVSHSSSLTKSRPAATRNTICRMDTVRTMACLARIAIAQLGLGAGNGQDLDRRHVDTAHPFTAGQLGRISCSLHRANRVACGPNSERPACANQAPGQDVLWHDGNRLSQTGTVGCSAQTSSGRRLHCPNLAQRAHELILGHEQGKL